MGSSWSYGIKPVAVTESVKFGVKEADFSRHKECKFCAEIHEAAKDSKQPKMSSRGWIILGVTGTLAVAIYGVTLPFVMPGFRRICLPYVPATQSQIDNVVRSLQGRTGSCIDLGSGDGRILFSIAEKCKRRCLTINSLVGVELNPWLVWYSRYKVIRNRIDFLPIYFKKQDIFKTSLCDYNNIVVFGVEQLMINLEAKLEQEMMPEGIVLACRFPLPNWEACSMEGDGIDKVWVYKHPTMGKSV